MVVMVRKAESADLDSLAILFDGYRQFYKQGADLVAARQFLLARMENAESTIFIAEIGDKPVGFTQLYPSFSSVRLGRVFVLNDLFVAPEARGTGAGGALLDAAAVYARDEAAIGLSLRTAIDNETAQRLYEANGWTRDQKFYQYDLSL